MNKLALTAIAALALPATAQTSFSDDLTDGSFDPAFNYDFSSDFAGNGIGGDFNEIDAFGLCICSDEVVITFPGVGEPVGLAQVDFTDFTGIGATEVEFFGTLGSMLFTNASVGSPETAIVTPLDGLGEITSVRISAFETFVDTVSIRTIPTPATSALAGLAGLAALRRRR